MNRHTENNTKALGRHLLLELYSCNVNILNKTEAVKNILVEAALAANATIIETSFHHFSPQGVSGVVVIAESHLTIHTWPEHQYAAVDVFICNETINTKKIERILVNKFEAKRFNSSFHLRGKLSQL
jgi:S-adenosylmethionine decarboxylase proenzyme